MLNDALARSEAADAPVAPRLTAVEPPLLPKRRQYAASPAESPAQLAACSTNLKEYLGSLGMESFYAKLHDEG